MPDTYLPHVVIVGGGFGGLGVAQNLASAAVRVTLVDRRNFHLFQPLLYQVATGGLSPANIAAPLRAILKRQRNTTVILGEVTDIDVGCKRVLLKDGALDYDTLVIATGSHHHYFGRNEWAPLAPGLKTIEDATEIRRRVLLAFEQAERESDPERLRALLTFVIVGAGPTGVELAGALAEISLQTLKRNFRRINPSDARIHLLEGAERVLPPFVPKLSQAAVESLYRLNVIVHTGAKVTDIQPGRVTFQSAGKAETIAAHTVLWAAGVMASPLGKILARATDAQTDKGGRVLVERDLSIVGHSQIFVIGDLACCKEAGGKPLPGVAPVAMQQGRYVARLIKTRLRGKSMPPFRYKNHGTMATIGRSSAVVDLGWVRFSGFFAWLAWLFVHLMYIVEFQNRLLVLFQWAWNYFTRNRSARLITGPAQQEAGQEAIEHSSPAVGHVKSLN